jgi:hypothetical protein
MSSTSRNCSTLVSKNGLSQPIPAELTRPRTGPKPALQPSRPAMTQASLATSITTHLVALARIRFQLGAGGLDLAWRQIGDHELPAIAE